MHAQARVVSQHVSVMIASVDWATAVISLGAAVVGLVVGFLLRSREWLKDKRLDIYDAFLRACFDHSDAIAERQHELATYYAEAHGREPVTKGELAAAIEYGRRMSVVSDRKIQTFLALRGANDRLRLVGSGQAMTAGEELLRALMTMSRAVTDPPGDEARYNEAVSVVTRAEARFAVIAARDLGGFWRLRRHRLLARQRADDLTRLVE
jgi:hypothetical protein